jgi:hypothetical protein
LKKTKPAEENGDDPVVHRVSRETVEPTHDQLPRRIDGRQRAVCCGKELPDGSEQNHCTDEDGQRRQAGGKR